MFKTICFLAICPVTLHLHMNAQANVILINQYFLFNNAVIYSDLKFCDKKIKKARELIEKTFNDNFIIRKKTPR